MGCDIHCYVEYKQPEWEGWNSFGGRINPGRSYYLFAQMAGVRSYKDCEVKFTPRGLPLDVGYQAKADAYLFVSDLSPNDEGHVSKAQAEKYISNGSSQYRQELDGTTNRNFITHPDWHSHSYLTLEELNQLDFSGAPLEYHALFAAMESFRSSNCEVRLVFWFDN